MAADGMQSAPLEGIGAQVTSVAGLRDGADGKPTLVAAGTLDGVPRILMLSDLSSEHTMAAMAMVLPGPPVRVGGIARGPDDGEGFPTVLTASNDAVVRFWRLGDVDAAAEAAAEAPAAEAGVAIPAVAPAFEGKGHELGCQAVLALTSGRIVSAGYDGRMIQWDAATGEAVQVLDTGAPTLALCELRAGGPGAAGASCLVASATASGTIGLTDVRGGGSNARAGRLGSHEDEQCNSVCQLGGGLVASGGCDGTVRLWDLRMAAAGPVAASAASSSSPAGSDASRTAGGGGGGGGADLMSRGGKAAAGSMEAAMARARGGKRTGRPGDPLTGRSGEEGAEEGGGVGSARGRAAGSAEQGGEWVYAVAPGPGGDTVWSGGADGTVRLWRAAGGGLAELGRVPGVPGGDASVICAGAVEGGRRLLASMAGGVAAVLRAPETA